MKRILIIGLLTISLSLSGCSKIIKAVANSRHYDSNYEQDVFKFKGKIKEVYGENAFLFNVEESTHVTGNLFESGNTVFDNGLIADTYIGDKPYKFFYNIPNNYIMSDCNFEPIVNELVDMLPIDKSLIKNEVRNTVGIDSIVAMTSNNTEPNNDNCYYTDYNIFITRPETKTFKDLVQAQNSAFTIYTVEDLSNFTVDDFAIFEQYVDLNNYKRVTIDIINKKQVISIYLNNPDKDNGFMIVRNVM